MQSIVFTDEKSKRGTQYRVEFSDRENLTNEKPLGKSSLASPRHNHPTGTHPQLTSQSHFGESTQFVAKTTSRVYNGDSGRAAEALLELLVC